MSLPVFLYSFPTPPAVGQEVTVSGAEGRHAVSVTRTKPGQQVELSNGAGIKVRLLVTAVAGKDHLTGIIEAIEHAEPPALTVTVIQAIPKAERSELAVDLLTQAGVDVIVPWEAERCIATWAGKETKAMGKWQAAATAAAKQARRAYIPHITPVLRGTEPLMEQVATAHLCLVLHEEAATPLAQVPLPETGTICVIIGPEGGLSPQEVIALQGAGAVPVKLGPEVLRTASAGMVALAAIGVRTSRW